MDVCVNRQKEIISKSKIEHFKDLHCYLLIDDIDLLYRNGSKLQVPRMLWPVWITCLGVVESFYWKTLRAFPEKVGQYLFLNHDSLYRWGSDTFWSMEGDFILHLSHPNTDKQEVQLSKMDNAIIPQICSRELNDCSQVAWLRVHYF